MKNFIKTVGRSVLVSMCAGAAYSGMEKAYGHAKNLIMAKRPLESGEETIVRTGKEYVTIIG